MAGKGEAAGHPLGACLSGDVRISEKIDNYLLFFSFPFLYIIDINSKKNYTKISVIMQCFHNCRSLNFYWGDRHDNDSKFKGIIQKRCTG